MRSLFDVERFRSLPQRVAVAQTVGHPTLVLGSTQRPGVVSMARASAQGVEVVRRRGGGGAVLLRPGEPLWVDAWVPRHDPLWSVDVSVAASRIGSWWHAALGSVGVRAGTVHEGRAAPGDIGDLVCFAGRGPGEVFYDGRKVVGLSQWRGREGALFSACAYAHWEPAPLIALLDVDDAVRARLSEELPAVAAGVAELAPGLADLAALREGLSASFPTWENQAAPSPD